jgi:hypothetical protein
MVGCYTDSYFRTMGRSFQYRDVRSWTAREYGLCIFAIAILVRVALLLRMRLENEAIGAEVVRIATSLATRGAYADPYAAMRTGPTAHSSPGYPLFLALEFFLFGAGKLGAMISYYVNVLFSAAQYALLPALACVLDVPPVWGFAGGMIGAIVPVNFLSEAKSGESLSGLVFLLMVMLTLRAGKSAHFSFAKGFLHGILWGVTLLIGSTGLLLLIGLLFVLALQSRRRLRGLAVYAVALALGAAIPISPWAIRNQRALGAPILLRDNLGLELAVGFNDTAGVTMYETDRNGTYARVHPNISPEQARRVRDLGELAYMRSRMAEGRDWIARHPARTAQLIVLRAIGFWFPVTDRFVQVVILWGLTLLAFLGLPVIWRASRLGGQTIAAIWLLFPIPYWLVIFSARYRLQIQFAFLLPAGAAIVYGLNWLGERRAADER